MFQRRQYDSPGQRMFMTTVMYAGWFLAAFAVYGLLHMFWGDKMLVDLGELAETHGNSVWDGLGKVWFIFLWGAGVTLLAGYILRHKRRDQEPGEVLAEGWWASINAGIFEELIFRWLIFVNAMVTLPWLNTITFGFIEWFQTSVLIPVANFATFGALEPQLLGHPGWVFGAAVVVANISFRDEHKYLGPFGLVNSWFIGMVMFYLMFNYGIVAAIAAHVLYDVVVFTAIAIAAAWREAPSPAYARPTSWR